MDHILDRPAWSALVSRHTELSQGNTLARRYDPTIVPFAAARDDAEDSAIALGSLVEAGGNIILLQAPTTRMPPGIAATLIATGVQMVLERPPDPVDDPRIEQLGVGDAPAMLALAQLTRPGPFTLRAQELGEFWGMRDGGRLIAMAGERMKPDGYAEVSGICTHPDVQGRGLGRLLSAFMTRRILERGETPFLHTFADNHRAIRLYEAIGFRLRTRMHIAVLVREGDEAATRTAFQH